MNTSNPKPLYVADTVALVLHLENRRLGADAARAFQEAEQNQAILYIPALAFAEVMYLSERQRISIGVAEVMNYLGRYLESVFEAPLNLEIIAMAQTITDIPELHDRLIAATARALGAKLITNDQTLQASQFVQTLW